MKKDLSNEQWLYGQGELASFLSICKTQASILTNGKLKGTWFRTGSRKLVFDKEAVISRLKETEA